MFGRVGGGDDKEEIEVGIKSCREPKKGSVFEPKESMLKLLRRSRSSLEVLLEFDGGRRA